MNFKLAFTSYEAVKYACKNWHYSRCLPVGKLFKIGVWEEDRFIGCLIYSMGACPQIHRPFNVKRNEICELTRIALDKHKNPVSKFLSISLKMLKKEMPILKLVVSYADIQQEHHGGIYQATNWIYLCQIKKEHYIDEQGFSIHCKTFYGKPKNLRKKTKTIKTYKHKYIYCLDKETKKTWMAKSKPYPKKDACVV
jgi:hypothetical protein